MALQKAEYDANGKEVVVHFHPPEDYSTHSAWVDGRAVYLDRIYDNPEILPDWLADGLSDSLSDSGRKEIKDILAFLTETQQLICKRCDTLFPHSNYSSVGFAGVECGACANEKAHCPDSDDGSHEDTCLNPSKKRNARVPTKYKCKHCGRKRETLPTG